jgi:hypothetical protein
MHSAPAVVFPVGRSHFEVWLIGALISCEGFAWLSWCLSVDAIGWSQIYAGALVVVFSVWLLMSWWRTPQGRLSWDGMAWALCMNGQTTAVNPELVFDLQLVMLLRLGEPESTRARWVWLERASSSLRWFALRRAVHQPPVPPEGRALEFGEPSVGMPGRAS